MTQTVSFPGLGLEFELNRVAFSVGPFTVYWYGIIVMVGILLGVLFAVHQGKKMGIDPNKMLDVLIYSIVAGLVGARIYYVAFSWDYYSQHPAEIIRIWEGGIAFYGGVIGALICGAVLCHRWKLPLVQGMDAALGGLLLGQSIGRWGNFVNIEAFGGYFKGTLRMVSPAIDAYFHTYPEKLAGFTVEKVLSMTEIPVHPTFFYESVWTMLGFLFIVWYTPRRKFYGELSMFYFAWNGMGRLVIEALRTDSLMYGTYRVSQLLAAVMLAISCIMWSQARKLIKNREKAMQAAAAENSLPAMGETVPETEQEAVLAVSDEAAQTEETENGTLD